MSTPTLITGAKIKMQTAMYQRVISELSRELKARNVSLVQVLSAVQHTLTGARREEPSAREESESANDLVAVHSWLSSHGVSNQIDVDFLLALLGSLNQDDLRKKVQDYAYAIADCSPELQFQVTPEMQECFFMFTYHNPPVAKICEIWDAKELMSKVLGIPKSAFWFVGYQDEDSAVLVWQFPLINAIHLTSTLHEKHSELISQMKTVAGAICTCIECYNYCHVGTWEIVFSTQKKDVTPFQLHQEEARCCEATPPYPDQPMPSHTTSDHSNMDIVMREGLTVQEMGPTPQISDTTNSHFGARQGKGDEGTLPSVSKCLTQVDQWYDPASGSQHTSQGTGAENECTQEYPPSYNARPAAEKQRKRQRPTEYGVAPPTRHYPPQKKTKLPQKFTYSPADNAGTRHNFRDMSHQEFGSQYIQHKFPSQIETGTPQDSRPEDEMEQEVSEHAIDYQELIMRHQPAFMELANLPVLLPHLKSRGLLTREESQYLNNDFHTEQNRLRKLLEYMEYKGQEGCKKLLEAIAKEKTHTGHRQLYQQLTGSGPTRNSDIDDPQDQLAERGTCDAQDYRALLQKHHPDVMELLDLPSLLPHLIAHGLLTLEESEFLNNDRHEHQKRVRKLLEYMERKGPEGHQQFLQAIEEETTHIGHRQLYERLTNSSPGSLSPWDTLIKSLKAVYTSANWYKKGCGPHSGKLEFIRLALIQKRKISKSDCDSYKDKFLRESLHGLVDDIERRKCSLMHTDIFEYSPKDPPTKRVLIEGAPGIGKTFLSLHLSAEWARGEILKEYDCVLFIPLRRFQEKVNASQHTLGYKGENELDVFDLIKLYLGGKRGFQASEELSRRQGERTLLILEGWDELAPDLRQEFSFFSRIICGDILPKASVMVTSRPTVSNDLYEYLDERRIEVLGFNSEQKKEFVARNMPTKKNLILKHLQKFPNIQQLSHIPMTLQIICTLAEYTDSLPPTLTELYDMYLKNVLLVGLKKQPKDEFKELKGIGDINELPEKAQSVLDSLSTLALQGFLNKRFVFKLKDLRKENLNSEGSFDGYGLLSSVPCYAGAGYEMLYQFRHLTVQEFLAARKIGMLPHREQMSLLQEYRSDKQFRVVWKFLSGITKLEDEQLRDAIIFKTRPKSNRDVLFLLHCIYEVHSPELCRDAATFLNHKLNLGNMCLDATDCLCMAYTMVEAGGEWHLDLRRCCIGGEGLEILRQHLTDHKGSHPLKIAALDIISNSLHIDHKVPLLPPGAQIIANFINCSIPITEINLNSHAFTDEDIRTISEALSRNTTLQSVEMATCTISAVGAKYLAMMLRKNTTLKILFLRWNALGDDGATHLASALKENNTLTELSIGDNGIGRTGLCHLVEMSKVNTSLEILRIEGNGIGSTECQILTEMFPHNHTLKLVDMTKNKFGDAGVSIITEGLKKHPECGFKKLGFYGCNITDQGVEKVCELITTNQLETLHLGGNHGITDVGAGHLARALRANTSVRIIRLEHTRIEERGKKLLEEVKNSRSTYDLDITYVPNIHLQRRLQSQSQSQSQSAEVAESSESLNCGSSYS